MFGLGFLVCMDEQRQVRAYHNVCSHRAMAVATGDGRAPMCEGGGTMSGLRFECPYHGWQFDMDGRFRGCKISNGLAGIRNFTPETSSLWPIRCEVWGPLVFLHLGDNKDLPPVAEVMGAGGELLASEGLKDGEWQFYKRVEYPMACNWKCMVDNYEDGNYHVYLAHSHLVSAPDAGHRPLFFLPDCAAHAPSLPADQLLLHGCQPQRPVRQHDVDVGPQCAEAGMASERAAWRGGVQHHGVAHPRRQGPELQHAVPQRVLEPLRHLAQRDERHPHRRRQLPHHLRLVLPPGARVLRLQVWPALTHALLPRRRR